MNISNSNFNLVDDVCSTTKLTVVGGLDCNDGTIRLDGPAANNVILDIVSYDKECPWPDANGSDPNCD